MGCQILAFSTEDCHACDILKPIVKEAAEKIGIDIKNLDPTIEIELAQKYSVSIVPTFVLLDLKGDFIESVDGFIDDDTINSFLSLADKEVVA